MIATLHKSREYLTCAVAIFFLLPMQWVSYLLALWILLSLTLVFTQIGLIKKKDIKNTLLYVSPFFLLAVSLQLHGGGGMDILERALSFLVFPVCVFLSQLKISKAEFNRLTWIFVIGCCLLAIKGPVMYLIIGPHFPYSEQHDFIYRYRAEFNENTDVSPTYACIYFGFAIVMVMLQLKEFTKQKGLLISLLVFLFINMILLSSKMPFIATMAILFFFFIGKRDFFRRNDKRNIWLFSAGVVILTFVLLFFTRWGEFITGFGSNAKNGKENTLDVRKMISECDLELTSNYFLTGIGPQHLQKKLDQCYYQFEGNAFSRNHFNTHNQYFDYLLSHGITGLLLLLIVMIVPLYRAIRSGDQLMASFIVLIMLCMLTENILSRQAGIVFYAFFNALLLNRKLEKTVG